MKNNKLKITSENNNNKILVYDRVEIDRQGTSLYMLQVSKELWTLLLENQPRADIEELRDYTERGLSLPEYVEWTVAEDSFAYENWVDTYSDLMKDEENSEGEWDEWIDESIISPAFLPNSVRFILKAGIGMDVKFNIAHGIDGNDLETILVSDIGDTFFKKGK